MSSTPEGFLPECIGPKLGPFAHPNTDLNFSELISDNELGDSSDVGHAHVFKVVIGSNTFALKIVSKGSTEAGSLRFEYPLKIFSVQVLR